MMRIPSTGAICFACRGGDYVQCSRNRCILNSWLKSLLGTIEAKYYAKRATYGMVDVIVCPSEFIKKQLDTDPLLAYKTIIMHNFIETDAVGGKIQSRMFQSSMMQITSRKIMLYISVVSRRRKARRHYWMHVGRCRIFLSYSPVQVLWRTL